MNTIFKVGFGGISAALLFLSGFGASQFYALDLHQRVMDEVEQKQATTQGNSDAELATDTGDNIFTVETLAEELFKSQTFPTLTIVNHAETGKACVPGEEHSENEMQHLTPESGCITEDEEGTVISFEAQPVEEIVYERNRVNMMAYPELFGSPVQLTHTKLKNILPDEPEKKLYELAVRLELMPPEDAISLLVALSRNYQTGDHEKTAFYDAVTGVSASLGAMSFSMEATVAGYCGKALDANDMLLLITNKRISRTYARLYQKRRVVELEGWVKRYNVCSLI